MARRKPVLGLGAVLATLLVPTLVLRRRRCRRKSLRLRCDRGRGEMREMCRAVGLGAISMNARRLRERSRFAPADCSTA